MPERYYLSKAELVEQVNRLAQAEHPNDPAAQDSAAQKYLGRKLGEAYKLAPDSPDPMSDVLWRVDPDGFIAESKSSTLSLQALSDLGAAAVSQSPGDVSASVVFRHFAKKAAMAGRTGPGIGPALTAAGVGVGAQMLVGAALDKFAPSLAETINKKTERSFLRNPGLTGFVSMVPGIAANAGIEKQLVNAEAIKKGLGSMAKTAAAGAGLAGALDYGAQSLERRKYGGEYDLNRTLGYGLGGALLGAQGAGAAVRERLILESKAASTVADPAKIKGLLNMVKTAALPPKETVVALRESNLLSKEALDKIEEQVAAGADHNKIYDLLQTQSPFLSAAKEAGADIEKILNNQVPIADDPKSTGMLKYAQARMINNLPLAKGSTIPFHDKGERFIYDALQKGWLGNIDLDTTKFKINQLLAINASDTSKNKDEVAKLLKEAQFNFGQVASNWPFKGNPRVAEGLRIVNEYDKEVEKLRELRKLTEESSARFGSDAKANKVSIDRINRQEAAYLEKRHKILQDLQGSVKPLNEEVVAAPVPKSVKSTYTKETPVTDMRPERAARITAKTASEIIKDLAQ